MFDAPDDRHFAVALQVRFAGLRVTSFELHAHAIRVDIAHGKRPAACAPRFLHDVKMRLTCGNMLAQCMHERFGSLVHHACVLGEHAQRGNLLQGRLRVKVQAQRGLKRRKRHLVQAHGASKRVLLQAVDIGFLAYDDAGLRAA